jgi:predicted ATPase
MVAAKLPGFTLIHLSKALLILGHVDQARLRRDEALTEARRVFAYNLAYTLACAWVCDWIADGVKSAPTMLRSADELLAVSSEHGFSLWFAGADVMRGWCLAALGRAGEGLPLHGLGNWRATGANLWVPYLLLMVAETYAVAGQPRAGLESLAEAADLIETTQERCAEADMHRLRGTLLQSMGEHAAAEDSYRHALETARRQSAKFCELRAATSLARLWCDQGKPIEARDLLAPIYGWFTEGFDTPVLQNAKALLDELHA